MRILYDGYIFKYQKVGGINRYFTNIINKLSEDYQPVLTTPSIHSFNFPQQSNLKIIKYRPFRPERLSNKLEKLYFGAVTKRLSFDILHPTYYSLLSGQELVNIKFPVIVTVWDMIHELFHQQLDPYGLIAKTKIKAINAAEMVISISENTKSDLIKIYQIPPEKIQVIPLASDIDKSQSFGDEVVPIEPYYLYVGTRHADYKNFKNLLVAFAKIITKSNKVHLCVVGPPFSLTEQKLISELKINKYIEHFGQVNDCHLAKLYRCSIALVYPSLYEGFGIPPLEAISCGTTVIAANTSSLPEVIGDAGLLFDPAENDSLAERMLYLIDNPIQRDTLILKGQQRAKLFSWDFTANQTIDIYNKFSKVK